MKKRFYAGQGVVATDNLDTIYQREIFFQVDPMTLDGLNFSELKEMIPSGTLVEIDWGTLLPYLPELEQEIFFLVFLKQKGQKDIAKLLGLSQPTISYRYRRVLAKLSYLIVLVTVDARELIGALSFLKDKEKDVLHDLLFYTNQELVGKKHGVRQSSVKWIFTKTKRRLAGMERQDPDTWGRHYGLLLLLDRNLCTRVLY